MSDWSRMQYRGGDDNQLPGTPCRHGAELSSCERSHRVVAGCPDRRKCAGEYTHHAALDYAFWHWRCALSACGEFSGQCTVGMERALLVSGEHLVEPGPDCRGAAFSLSSGDE